MKRTMVTTSLMMLTIGCGIHGPRTLENRTLTETRVATLGDLAGRFVAERVRAKHGLASEEGLRLARAGRALNAVARALAQADPPIEEDWAAATGFLRETLDLSIEEGLLLAEGVALMNELAAQVEGSSRARLWLALFFQSASHAILEVYQYESIGGADHGRRPGDPLGDS